MSGISFLNELRKGGSTLYMGALHLIIQLFTFRKRYLERCFRCKASDYARQTRKDGQYFNNLLTFY